MIVKGAFEKARIYIESRCRDSETNPKKSNHGPCITISRETGAGADKVGEELAKIFNSLYGECCHPWTVFDKNLIEKVIEDHHLPEKLRQYFVEDKLSEIKSTVNELFGIHPSSWVLLSKTASTILQLAQIGNVIIVGRGANIITRHLKNSFHIRLISPMEERIKRIEDIYNLPRKDAVSYIVKEDLARKNYIKKYFNQNVNDLNAYHLIVNTGLLSYEKAAKTICDAVFETYPNLFEEYTFTSKFDYA